MTEYVPAETCPHAGHARHDNQVSHETPQRQMGSVLQREITCTRCSHANPDEHRYCRACGLPLWKACPRCTRYRPIDEAFCAACGQDIAAGEEQLVQEHSIQLAGIEQLAASLQLHEAIAALQALLAAAVHPCLEDVRQTATALLGRVTAQRDELRAECARHARRGRRLLDACRYHDAGRELEQIPARFRDEETNMMLAEVTDRLQEIDRLRREIAAPRGGGPTDRMRRVARLVALLPHDTEVLRCAREACEQSRQRAQEMLQAQQYASAVELLRCIPESVADAAVATLLRRASELEYLWSEVELAPYVTPATLQAAARLVRLDPDNRAAREKHQEMRRRLAADRPEPPAHWPRWAPSPPRTFVGMPVLPGYVPCQLGFSGPEVRRSFMAAPELYSVACGLALQALGKAPVGTNLLPARPVGLLGALRASKRERQARAGWGLDLTNSGLKAVRMVLDAAGQPTIAHCVCLPQRASSPHAHAAPEKQAEKIAGQLDTLARFTATHSISASDNVGVSWPAVQTLVRFLQLPAAGSRKYREMLEHEVRLQIPVPLDQVTYDTHTYVTETAGEQHASARSLLLAVRTVDLESHLAVFQEAGIAVQVLQCDAVALHNFVQADRPAEGTVDTPGADASSTVILDVGAETTNIVFSTRHAIWFRSVRPAGDDIESALVQRFKLARDVATAVVHQPAKAARMSAIYQQTCRVFQELAVQLEGCISQQGGQLFPDGAERLLVVGGAGATPGLLRFLTHGR